MSIISAKSGINLFHYHLIGTGIILTYDSQKSILYHTHEETGRPLKMIPIQKRLDYKEFLMISRNMFLYAIAISN